MLERLCSNRMEKDVPRGEDVAVLGSCCGAVLKRMGCKSLLLLNLFPSFRALLHKGFHGKAVAIGTKPCDDALAHGTDERSVAEKPRGHGTLLRCTPPQAAELCY